MKKRETSNYLLAHYDFNNNENPGQDQSKHQFNAELKGKMKPFTEILSGRQALTFNGGENGSSFLELPSNLLNDISDATGITISTWVYFRKAENVWERIFDFGSGPEGPYLFMTRNARGVCYADGDLVADASQNFPTGEWLHLSMSIHGTEGGTLSSAGPMIYLNGECVADGSISQTSSGMYKRLRQWFKSFENDAEYNQNYIGRSQHVADLDFYGSMTDFRIYKAGLSQDEVIEVMCESLSDQEIVELAKEKYLSIPTSIVSTDIDLPSELMGGKVQVHFKSSEPDQLADNGHLGRIESAKAVILTAILTRGEARVTQAFELTVLPKDLPSHYLKIKGDSKVVDISDVMYGLFYEDINNAADGGIYAELVQNRSFESFAFDTYDPNSGACGCSTGRNHQPLHAWYGDTDRVIVKTEGGLNEHFQLEDKEVNSHYIMMPDGSTLINRGFNDSNDTCQIAVKEGQGYTFTVWAKAKKEGKLTIHLETATGELVSQPLVINISGGDSWAKYGVQQLVELKAEKTAHSQLVIKTVGDIALDMVSLIPVEVWGASEEPTSSSAHHNYLGNPNYRLRKDLVEALVDLNPKFLRFPGGCISEGSYIWDNVYEWKDSIGPIETRKENFNVWGYMMTMGLGYMEYFQLAEDLNATPLPVMACGVLCQARSDYVHPAGGKLRDYYVKSFTDLIDFAINTDYEGNEWAKLRKQLGHEQPFDLHYLGVGNENWGSEFFSNFEYFKTKIDRYMDQNYPGYTLHIISTVGAQADDDAYQEGWKFLSGNLKGEETITFTDGKDEFQESISWYGEQSHYMDTIADEHYYRSNTYLLNNADRYNYYYRDYNVDGSINEETSSKVFVGEFASTDKNTLAGAVAEAAIMTGYENNADVVKLIAYAPLFNKVLTDGTYRWTPDLIWFDDTSVWYTPNYYVQKLFAQYIGHSVLDTDFSYYEKGELTPLMPRGGITLATGKAEIILHQAQVVCNKTQTVLFEQDFTKPLADKLQLIPGSKGYQTIPGVGVKLLKQEEGRNGFYLIDENWSDYSLQVKLTKSDGEGGVYIGVGVTNIRPEKQNLIEYAIHYRGNETGIKVFKQGIEGYTLGDYSSSQAAGNLRSSYEEAFEVGVPHTVTINYGGLSGDRLTCSYQGETFKSSQLDYKLSAYNREIFHTVSIDQDTVYVKLVNADGFNKLTEISLESLHVEESGKIITVTGDSTILDVANVNQKGNERVVPVSKVINVVNNRMTVSLDAHSVNVIILKRHK